MKTVGKGSVLSIEVATVLTPIAQLTSIDLPEAETETFESDTLDNTDAGIPHEPTGRTEGGSVGFEGFLDPALASHKILTNRLKSPLAPEGGAITFADAGTTQWAFETAGTTLGGSIVLNDGVRFTGSLKLSGIPNYPA